MKRALGIVGLALAVGCSSSSPDLSIAITLGHETGAMTAAPAVTDLRVDALNAGAVVASAHAAPGGTLDFGQLDQGNTIELDATGTDAKGDTVMLGRTLDEIVVGAQGVAPLFVQRTGTWARPPGELERAHVGGVAVAFLDHEVLLTGGSLAGSKLSPTTTEFYDVLTMSPDPNQNPAPLVVRSMVMQGSRALLIGDDGAQTSDVVNNQTWADATLPAGLKGFGDVAGGAPILAPSGIIYLVGATRSGPATDAVLAVATDGSTLTAIHLKTPRAGAAAAFIPNVGLVVAGGSATGEGVEVLADSGTSFGTVAFPSDATIGAALVTTGGDKPQALLIGGVLAGKAAPTRSFDASCVSKCPTMTSITTAALPIALGQTWAYEMAPNRLLVVGSEAEGAHMDRTFIVDLGLKTNQVVEAILREPRSGATPVPAQNGTLALMGGAHADGTPALTIETFFPQ